MGYRRSAKEDRGSAGSNASVNEDACVSLEADQEVKEGFSKPAPLETTLGEKWHAFYDLRGVKYYYNFETQESMRRPQEDLINPQTEEAKHNVQERHEIVSRLAMAKDPRLLP